MNKLPNELIDYIISYMFAECNHCLKKTYYLDLQKSVVINKYRHISNAANSSMSILS